MNDDERWMGAAVALAERGRGQTFPNPNVGCVIVKQERVVGRGWTQPGGRPHAEAIALTQAGSTARGATLYTTLEPCAHVSERGPTCSRLIAEAQIARVVVAVRDPDPRTDGAGAAALAQAGVTVIDSVAEASATAAMSGFLMRQRTSRPHVTLKLALSLDGCIAMGDGTSQWITGAEARAHGHLERARADAIIVGRGTFASDAPALDVRLAGLAGRSPGRYVLTTGSLTTEGWKVLSGPGAIADLPADLILVEGGAGAASAFIAADLVDRLLIYRAPILIGGGKPGLSAIGLETLADAHGRWRSMDTRSLGVDRLDICERVRE